MFSSIENIVSMKKILLIALWLSLSIAIHTQADNVSVAYDPGVPTISFAADKIKKALTENGHQVGFLGLDNLSASGLTVKIVIISRDHPTAKNLLRDKNQTIQDEGYTIHIEKKSGTTFYYVVGGTDRGAMYGGLDVMEKILGNGKLASIASTTKNPYIKKRGIKFNIPLDARTPSYSDNNVFAQENIQHVWDMDFWKEYFDEMALNRLNLLTLWSLCPFPSMVRVPEYPNIGLDDVKRTTIPITEFGSSSSGKKNVTPEVLENLETIKTITLDEKIKFWQEVMQYASDRGVDIYLYTWNIFVFGTEGSGYGLTDDVKNEKTKDYLRKATKAMLKTYPLLKGMGVTAGENMSHEAIDDERFLFEAYGLGINDALKENPNRTFQLAHRLGDITVAKEEFKGLHPRCSLSFCYKYSKAHVYSSVAPYWIRSHEFLEEIGDDTGYFITIRDDSHYYLRSGSDPNFTRSYIKNIPNNDINFNGFQLGADGIVWGREAVSKEAASPRQQMVKKRWYSLRLWGMLAYDPDKPDEDFIKMLRHRFPEVEANTLFEAWSKASQVVPLVNRFHNHKAYLDYQWSPELCDSRAGYNSETGFHDMNTFIRIKVQKEEGLIGIPDFVNGDKKGTTPFQVAENLLQLCTQTLDAVSKMDQPNITDKELDQTISDIKALAYLGGYYGLKISASTNKALYDKKGDNHYKDLMMANLQHASNYWWKYSHQLSAHYKPMFYSRLKKQIDVLDIQKHVDKEILDHGGKIPSRNEMLSNSINTK